MLLWKLLAEIFLCIIFGEHVIGDDHYIEPTVQLFSCLGRTVVLFVTDSQLGGIVYIKKDGVAYNMMPTENGTMFYTCTFDECQIEWRKPLVQTTHDVRLVFTCLADQGDITPDDGTNKDQLDKGITTFRHVSQARMTFYNETSELPNGSYVKMGSYVSVIIELTNNIEEMMDVNVRSCEASGIPLIDDKCPVYDDLFKVFNKTAVGVVTNNFLMFRTTTMVEEPVTMLFSCVLEVCYAPCAEYQCNDTETVAVNETRRRRRAAGDIARSVSVTTMFKVGTQDPAYWSPEPESCIDEQLCILVFTILIIGMFPASASASYFMREWVKAKQTLEQKTCQSADTGNGSQTHQPERFIKQERGNSEVPKVSPKENTSSIENKARLENRPGMAENNTVSSVKEQTKRSTDVDTLNDQQQKDMRATKVLDTMHVFSQWMSDFHKNSVTNGNKNQTADWLSEVRKETVLEEHKGSKTNTYHNLLSTSGSKQQQPRGGKTQPASNVVDESNLMANSVDDTFILKEDSQEASSQAVSVTEANDTVSKVSETVGTKGNVEEPSDLKPSRTPRVVSKVTTNILETVKSPQNKFNYNENTLLGHTNETKYALPRTKDPGKQSTDGHNTLTSEFMLSPNNLTSQNIFHQKSRLSQVMANCPDPGTPGSAPKVSFNLNSQRKDAQNTVDSVSHSAGRPVYIKELKDRLLLCKSSKITRESVNDNLTTYDKDYSDEKLCSIKEKQLVSILKKPAIQHINQGKDGNVTDIYGKFQSCLRAGRRKSSIQKTDSLKGLINSLSE